MERRKRIKRPLTLKIFCGIMIVIPLINFINFAITNRIPIYKLSLILTNIPTVSLIILPIPFVIGIGLLLVRKWAWYLFLVWSVFLIIHNTYIAIINFSILNLSLIPQSIIAILMVIYFLRKDISAPYMKMYGRGWRGNLRKPIQKEISLNGTNLITRDISVSGFYVDWKFPEFNLNDEVTILCKEISDSSLKGGVVRLDENGIGVAFRDLDELQKEKLRRITNE